MAPIDERVLTTLSKKRHGVDGQPPIQLRTPNIHPALSPRRGRNARRRVVELNERFGSNRRRHEGSKKVRTTTESPKAADEVRDLPDLKQRSNGYPLLGERAG